MAVKLKQGMAVALLQALGVKAADSLSVEKLVAKLKKLPARIEAGEVEVPDDLSAENNDTLEYVKAAVESDEDIELKAGGGKKEKGEKAEGTKRKPPEMIKDDIGCRLGTDGKATTDGARINAALTKKPQTPEKIAEAAGVTPSRAKGHCDFHVTRGGGYEGRTANICKEGEGKEAKYYKLPVGEGAAPKKKKKEKATA